MPRVTEVPAEYDHVRWTGNNADDVASAVSAYHGTAYDAEEQQDGALQLGSGDHAITIPLGDVYLMGPIWGDVRSGQSSLVDHDTFTAKYQTA